MSEFNTAYGRIIEALHRSRHCGDAEPDGATMSEFRTVMDDDLNTPEAISLVFRTANILNKAVDEFDPKVAAGLRAAIMKMTDVLRIIPEGQSFIDQIAHEYADEIRGQEQESANNLIGAQQSYIDALKKYLAKLQVVYDQKDSATQEQVETFEEETRDLKSKVRTTENEYKRASAKLGALDKERESLLNTLSEARTLARKEKAFAVSDFIRERLSQLGYELRDLPDGKWEIKRRL
jgi:cysteinyl-tRNA synthetase